MGGTADGVTGVAVGGATGDLTGIATGGATGVPAGVAAGGATGVVAGGTTVDPADGVAGGTIGDEAAAEGIDSSVLAKGFTGKEETGCGCNFAFLTTIMRFSYSSLESRGNDT